MGIKRFIFKLTSKVGFGRYAYELADRILIDNWYEGADEAIGNFEMPSSEGVVFVPHVHGIQPSNTFWTFTLAHAFRCRGYEPILLQCDRTLPICWPKGEAYAQDGTDFDHPCNCDRCEYVSTEAAEALGLEPIELSALLPDGYEPPTVDVSLHDQREYRGIRVDSFARASTRRTLYRYSLDKTDPFHTSIFQRFISASMILIDAAFAVHENHDIVATLNHNNQYVDQGIFGSVANKFDIPAYTYSVGYRDGKLLIGQSEVDDGNDNTHPQFTEQRRVLTLLEQSLSETQERRLTEVLSRRFDGSASSVISPDTGRSISDESIPDDHTVLGVFTNLVWDGTMEATGGAYGDPFDWTADTIEWARDEATDTTVVIKPHPAEAARGTNESVSEWIKERYTLPSNVLLLEPDTEVDTYELLDDIDVGVVFNSTVGLEAAYLGVPVIVSASTHYRDFDFTFDAADPDDYIDLLAEAGTLSMTDRMQQRAKRYAYFLLCRKHIDFPAFDADHSTLHDELKPGNENIDFIVDTILDGDIVETDRF